MSEKEEKQKLLSNFVKLVTSSYTPRSAEYDALMKVYQKLLSDINKYSIKDFSRLMVSYIKETGIDFDKESEQEVKPKNSKKSSI